MTPTPLQSATSRENSKSSTGPITEQGKTTSSQNAVKHGLYATTLHLTPEIQLLYNELSAAMLDTLRPANPLEQTCANEIVRSSWRLKRCATLEDANEDPATEIAIDRARTQALNHLLKATAELRRLQTNRQIQLEINPEGTDVSNQVLVLAKDVIAAHNNFHRTRLLAERVADMDEHISVIHKAVSAPVPVGSASFRKTTAPAPEPPKPTAQIARNVVCPCGSKDKYKRCCGKNAAPLLTRAA